MIIIRRCLLVGVCIGAKVGRPILTLTGQAHTPEGWDYGIRS